MTSIDRRKFLLAATASVALPAAIARAAAIDAKVRTGTLSDVAHVVILMQENRGFDHYFGTLKGVRGFGDRFPIPLASGKTVWTQANAPGRAQASLTPFPLDTAETFALMRVEGTPHSWADTQDAWDQGRMGHWPAAKTERSMAYFRKADLPFQFALADAFTLCDAYHCSIQTGTNSNRLFLWSGTNDPGGKLGGPAISNSHDSFVDKGGSPDSDRWTTYAERLSKAGVSWTTYLDMADYFGDNPTAGFKTFRDSRAGLPGSDPKLTEQSFKTRALDVLKADVLAGKLPQVSYVVSPAKDSEHPGPSSPAQGADYTARVLDALTADPAVWAKTVLLVMFDENDGFFDHMPPPSPPAKDAAGKLLGGSTVDTTGEYHLVRTASQAKSERDDLMGRSYGLGPRVPLYVISPWSRGGYVNSQVFDHTSVIRFLERRFGVAEPNLSSWRRAVCGDLTSAFNFRTPNDAPLPPIPGTVALAARAAALPGHTTPVTPTIAPVPTQAGGVRPSRALPYALQVDEAVEGGVLRLTFRNTGQASAVFQVYDRRHLDRVPRRYTVEPGKSLADGWEAGAYDLWVLGPNGFHRHFLGDSKAAEPQFSEVRDADRRALVLRMRNSSKTPLPVVAAPTAYAKAHSPWRVTLAPGAAAEHRWLLAASGGWYDFTVTAGGVKGYARRLAGRLEGQGDSISDPEMAGQAVMTQWSPA
ncbi:phospholipase C, phosphocholine-specific [soil metagenome]